MFDLQQTRKSVVYKTFLVYLIIAVAQSSAFSFSLSAFAAAAEPPAASGSRTIQTVPGMPPVMDPNHLYSETRPDNFSPAIAKHLARVYVPNRASNDVTVIDPATLKVIDRFAVGINPQHVVPSWDLKDRKSTR